MDLSRATIEQMTEELRRRDVEFSLIVVRRDSEGPREDDYRVYSSEGADMEHIGEAVRCQIGSLAVLSHMAEQVDDEDDEKGSSFWRWVAVGETVLNDIFRTTEEWGPDEQHNGHAH